MRAIPRIAALCLGILICPAAMSFAQGGLGGVMGDLGGDGDSKPQPGEGPASDPPAPTQTPEPVSPDPAAELDRLIASLEESLTALERPSFKSVAAARQRSAELRARVDHIRRRLYVGEPPGAAAKIQAFRERWGDLAMPILQGEIPDERIAAERWTVYARDFDDLHCARMTALTPPPNGIRPVGWAWACLSDLFFNELTQIEVGIAKARAEKRANVTQHLDAAIQTLEEELGTVTDADEPPRLFVWKIEGLVHAANRAEIEIRLEELRRRRNAGGDSEALRWLNAARSPAARPPVFARVRVKLEGASMEIEQHGKDASRLFALARSLHRARHRLTVLRLQGELSAEVLGVAEQQWRDTLFAIATGAD